MVLALLIFMIAISLPLLAFFVFFEICCWYRESKYYTGWDKEWVDKEDRENGNH